ncbi:MAG: hypothetical protein ACLQDM_16990 [Bradyrhizobium sp.]
MNHSLYSIDRTTHAKIVVIALMFATAVAGIGIAVHTTGSGGMEQAQHVGVIKAGKPAMVASGTEAAIR